MTSATARGFEPVIGLEVHAQLSTRTKIFCACPTTYGSPPNTQTCPVCLGHPGALPVLNRRAVELGLRAAVALGCVVHRRSRFARKNYFYPDLPKGYQISQYDEPLATDGYVTIELAERIKEIGLLRLHLEEDAGKLAHEGQPEEDLFSYVDLNRAGVPLVEIVTRPEIHSPEEAYLFLQRLRSILRYAGVCDGNMEQGSLRCDANVSVRRVGTERYGTRTELKNLNSFRNVQRALEYEIRRQIERISAGGEVEQDTVLWDAAAAVTRSMRGKEEAQDYRYFPDPDLPPLEIGAEQIARARKELPELPAARKRRLMEEHSLSDREAQMITLEAPLADYYERVAAQTGDPHSAANWVLNDLQRELNRSGRDVAEIPLPAEHLGRLIRLVQRGTISSTVARRDLFPELFETGRSPEELVSERGLEQVSEESELRGLVDEVLRANPQQVELYRAGKTGLLGYFVGRVMKASGGKANPRAVSELVKRMLD